MYDLWSYLQMMRDLVRMPAHEAAIRAVTRPGDVVLDLGAGAGVMGFLALQAGAARVYAVETNDALAVAGDVARANGLAERMICLQEDSRRIELPEPADLLIADIRGALPLLGDNLAVLADARRRLLRPGGRLIPLRDVIGIAPVECAKGRISVEGWRARWGDADYSLVGDLAANQWRKIALNPSDLLAPGAGMTPLDHEQDPPPDLFLDTVYRAERPGAVDGLGAWFEATLAPGISFSTAPGGPESVYGQAYFPLSCPHPVQPGDTISVRIQVHLAGKEPLWTWDVSVRGEGRPVTEERHSSFEGMMLSPDRLARRGASFVPALDEEGEIDRFLLERMNGTTALGDIAREAAARFPRRFARWEEALGRAGNLAQKYGRQGPVRAAPAAERARL